MCRFFTMLQIHTFSIQMKPEFQPRRRSFASPCGRNGSVFSPCEGLESELGRSLMIQATYKGWLLNKPLNCCARSLISSQNKCHYRFEYAMFWSIHKFLFQSHFGKCWRSSSWGYCYTFSGILWDWQPKSWKSHISVCGQKYGSNWSSTISSEHARRW